MANQEHVDRLLRCVEQWNAWRRDFPLVAPALSGAKLRAADLRWANLSQADLSQADLSGADLTGADLTGADLRWANLSGADLFRATLQRVRVGYTTFSTVNLTDAEGLSTLRHSGPSPISTSTLPLAAGTLPAPFLRGCGLSDWEIELSKLYQPTVSHSEANDILYQASRLRLDQEVISIVPFISYSHADMEFADKLHDALQAKGVRVWRDVKDLLPGHKMSTRIDEAVKLADRVILVCSEASLTSKWVHKEIRKAQAKEDELWRVHGERTEILIPIDLDGYLRSGWDRSAKDWVNDHLAADFRRWRDRASFDGQVERVIAALRDSSRSKRPEKE